MPEQAVTVQVNASPPLRDAAGAMGSAVQALEQGTSEAISAVGHFLSRTLYRSCYAVSHGVVFPVLLVVRGVPKDNAIVHGLVDGARAARNAVAGWDDEPVVDRSLHAESLGSAEAEPSQDGEESDDAGHRRRGGNRRTTAKPARSHRKR